MTLLTVTIEGHTFEVDLALRHAQEHTVTAVVNGEAVEVFIPDMRFMADAVEWMVVNSRPYEVVFNQELSWLRAYGGLHQIEVRDMDATTQPPRSGDGRVKAPIPGLITRVLVRPGEQVEAGQILLVLEAMKMENEIRAPMMGTVSTVLVVPQQSVARGDMLVEVV
ncbi:MAG: biotin attachment protein [Ardenticatenaceae bacterium]|nr:biotin/lipoyl-binding protein [Anaerolineales bacterium]MCB8918947.1 biotin attachment protein [Ardenticatenaceae bacterium]